MRYWRTLRLFWGASLAAEAEYRLNFVLALLTSLLTLGGSLFGLFLFYRVGYQPGGWPWEEALIVLGMFTLMDGWCGTFLSPNLNRIVTQVQDGTLDFVLLKPIDSQFWLSTRNFSLWGLPNVVFGVVMLAYAGWKLRLGPWGYAVGALPFLCGLVVLYSLWFLLAALSMWFVKIYNVTYVLKSILDAGKYPVGAYPATFRLVFTFVIPVAFLTTFPAEAVLGRGSATWTWAAVFLAVALFLASRRFWKFALRYYSSASS